MNEDKEEEEKQKEEEVEEEEAHNYNGVFRSNADVFYSAKAIVSCVRGGKENNEEEEE